MSVEDDDGEESTPPIKTEVGQVYYIKWRDGSENLLLMKDEYCYQVLASHSSEGELTAIDPDQMPFNPNWRLVKKVKLVPVKNLPLYVSWAVNKYYTKLIDKYAKEAA